MSTFLQDGIFILASIVYDVAKPHPERWAVIEPDGYGPDGKRKYKISGRFGHFRIILMQVYSHLLGHPRSRMLANVDFATFTREPDGSFEAIVSASPQRGNWVPRRSRFGLQLHLPAAHDRRLVRRSR